LSSGIRTRCGTPLLYSKAGSPPRWSHRGGGFTEPLRFPETTQDRPGPAQMLHSGLPQPTVLRAVLGRHIRFLTCTGSLQPTTAANAVPQMSRKPRIGLITASYTETAAPKCPRQVGHISAGKHDRRCRRCGRGRRPGARPRLDRRPPQVQDPEAPRSFGVLKSPDYWDSAAKLVTWPTTDSP
jgi:hypothetical protein